MLNVRGGLTGRVKKEGNLIPPPKQQPKPRKPVACWVPFLWSTFVGFFLGLFILLVGCGMAAVGFYAMELTTTYNVTYSAVEGGVGVTTQSSVPVEHNYELYLHLKRMVIVGPVVMGIGLTVLVVACTIIFEEREKGLRVRPGKEVEENKEKKGKYDLIVAKFKEEYSEAHVNEGFVADEAGDPKKIKDDRRSSVYSMDQAMKFASSVLISPFKIDSNEDLPHITMSPTLKSPPADNGWLQKSPLSEKRPNNRLVPLPSLLPLYGDDNTSLRESSWNSSQGSLNSTMNSLHNTSAKPHKNIKKSKSRESSLASIKKVLDEERCLPEQNGGTRISVEPEIKVTDAEQVNEDASDTNIVIHSSANHLHPEVVILNETLAASDYESSDQGSVILETKRTSYSLTSTGHR